MSVTAYHPALPPEILRDPAGWGGVALLTHRAAVVRSRAPARLRCPRAVIQCKGTLSLVGSARRSRHRPAKAVAVGRTSFSLDEGRAQKVTVSLSRAGRRLLAGSRGRRLRCAVKITAYDAPGAIAVTKSRLTLVLPRPRRHRRH